MNEPNKRISVPSEAKAGDIVEIKTLIMHPMHNGYKFTTQGTRIPVNIIDEFVCTFNDEEVVRVDLRTGISANPYVSFFARVDVSGTFRFTWHDDKGPVYEETADIVVV